MYEKYPITIEIVIKFSLYFGIFVTVLSIIIFLIKRTDWKRAILLSLKYAIISSIFVFLTGVSCRKEIIQIDYDRMVHDKSIQYFRLIMEDKDDSVLFKNIKKFVDSDQPATVKDTFKIKCKAITELYISVLNDLNKYCSFELKIDSFSISSKSKEIHDRLSLKINEKQIADSLVIPFVREMNNVEGEIFARIKIAKSFAEIDKLNNMQNSLKSYIEKSKLTYFNIFNEPFY